jgi:hypothetical protein
MFQFISNFLSRCHARLRLAGKNNTRGGSSDAEVGPVHPNYPNFNVRRSLRRVCFYYHPSHPHQRFEEIIDVIAIPSVTSTASNMLTTTVWEDNSPDSLMRLATKTILANPHVLFHIVEDEVSLCVLEADPEERPRVEFDQIHNSLILPSEICEYLLETMASEGLDIEDRVAKAFSDVSRSRLRRLHLRSTGLTSLGFALFAKHKLRELAIHNCQNLYRCSHVLLDDLNENMDHMVDLTIERGTGILPNYVANMIEIDDSEADSIYDDVDEEDKCNAGKYVARGYILKGPKLQRLAIRDLDICRGIRYFELLLRPLPKLTHLDLSGATHNEGFGDFEWLLHLNSLRSLVLHDVPEIDQSAMATISKIKTLR